MYITIEHTVLAMRYPFAAQLAVRLHQAGIEPQQVSQLLEAGLRGHIDDTGLRQAVRQGLRCAAVMLCPQHHPAYPMLASMACAGHEDVKAAAGQLRTDDPEHTWYLAALTLLVEELNGYCSSEKAADLLCDAVVGFDRYRPNSGVPEAVVAVALEMLRAVAGLGDAE